MTNLKLDIFEIEYNTIQYNATQNKSKNQQLVSKLFLIDVKPACVDECDEILLVLLLQ
jgi:hypothetical protein